MFGKLFYGIEPQPDHPRLIQFSCLRNRYRSSTCRRCADSCLEGAITFSPTVMLDEARCSGCLSCTAACPTEALTPSSSTTLQFRQQVSGDFSEKITVACTRNPYVQPDITVDCLAVFSTHDLAALILTAKVTELHLEYCTQCSRSAAIDNLRKEVDQVSRLVCSSADHGLMLIEKNTVPRSCKNQRRAFLNLFKKTVLRAATVQMEIVGKSVFSKRKRRHVPQRLEFLRQAICLSAKSEQKLGAKRLFPFIQFAERCDCCSKCVAACPTGSIQCDRKRDGPIRFKKSLCCGCGLCAEFCPVGAISISSSLL